MGRIIRKLGHYELPTEEKKMNKAVLFGAIVFSMLALFGHNLHAQLKEENNTMKTETPKILVAYYSYSGNTQEVAEAIHKLVGGDLFAIKTEGSYPEEYRPMTTQAKKEIDDGYRPKLTTSVTDIAQYDVIFLGSPNWWGTITPQVSSFLKTYNLSGKKVIPFITHGGGGVQHTVADMTAQCKGCEVSNEAWVGYGNRTMGLSGWLKDLGFSN